MMNKERKLRIVWLLSGIVVVLLFCLQAHWLYNQYQYNLDRRTEQFKVDCNAVLDKEFLMRNEKQKHAVKKLKSDTLRIEVQSKYDFKSKKKNLTEFTFYKNNRLLARIADRHLTPDDGYTITSRYLTFKQIRPSVAEYKTLLAAKGYSGADAFCQTRFAHVFLNARYEVHGHWHRVVTVRYQTNPMLRQGLVFEVPISVTGTLRSMFWQLVGSILLFIILVYCLLYLVRTILVQKRIDSLRHEFLKNMIYELKQPKPEGSSDDDEVFTIGTFTFHYAQNELCHGNDRVIITSRQAEILRLLAMNQGQLVERQTILDEVWGDDSYSNSLALNVQITYLRRAFKADPGVSIEAVIKKGYILRAYIK